MTQAIDSVVGADRRHSARTVKAALFERAGREGFDAAGVTTPDGIGPAGERLTAFLAEGLHGGMDWLEARAERRRHPAALWPDVCSIVMLGMNYAPEADPLAILAERWRGAVSVYARGRDYHDIVKGKLKGLAGWLARATGEDVKVFVDTAPVMEKPLAQAAGLGWQGKHTNLVSRRLGSWLFLGAIFTTARLPPDAPERDHCGTCRRCLDACPTNAFPAPYRLDARRCISYLTIEHKGHIAREFRRAIGNRIFGCDDCLAVCPWNKFAETAREAKFAAQALTAGAPLSDLLSLDDAAFRSAFAGTPVKRIGRDRFLRNVLMATGNNISPDGIYAPHADPRLFARTAALVGDPNPVVRAAAIWALRQMVPSNDPIIQRMRGNLLQEETDPDVLAELSESPCEVL